MQMSKSIFERFRTFCSDCSSMSSLLDIIGKGARAVRYSSNITNPEDFVMFCDKLEESLELVGRIQRDIANDGWELLEIIENLQLDDSDPNGDAHERSVVKGQAKRDAVGQPLT